METGKLNPGQIKTTAICGALRDASVGNTLVLSVIKPTNHLKEISVEFPVNWDTERNILEFEDEL